MDHTPYRARTFVLAHMVGLAVLGTGNLSAQTTRWTKVSPLTVPPAREGGSMAFDRRLGRAVLFGGMRDNSKPIFDDVWEWDGVNWFRRDFESNPPGRYYASLTCDSVRGNLVLFGGTDETGHLFADTWIRRAFAWVPALNVGTAPPARAFHAAAFDAARGELVMFGGYDLKFQRFGDTWVWNGSTWTKRTPTTSPSARYVHAMAYFGPAKRIILHGGFAVPNTPLADTWEWNGTTWNRLQVQGPTFTRHSLVFDEARGRLVAFGNTGPPTNTFETWEWDGSSWTKLPAPGPSIGNPRTATYDPVRRRALMSTGTLTTHETWVYDDGRIRGATSVFGAHCRAELFAAQGSIPTIGKSFIAEAQGFVWLPRTAVMSLGFSQTWLGPFRLPFSLQGFGFAGCYMNTSHDVVWTYGVSNGRGTSALAIPNDQSLAGTTVFLQTFAFGPNSLDASNGLALLIGSQ